MKPELKKKIIDYFLYFKNSLFVILFFIIDNIHSI